jgi:Flp pilus assembly pilin Flp
MLSHVRSLFIRFVCRDEGQDLIEYGLLGAFISIVSLVAIRAIGPLVNALYVTIQGALAP